MHSVLRQMLTLQYNTECYVLFQSTVVDHRGSSMYDVTVSVPTNCAAQNKEMYTIEINVLTL